jgi:hypothetical protein
MIAEEFLGGHTCVIRKRHAAVRWYHVICALQAAAVYRDAARRATAEPMIDSYQPKPFDWTFSQRHRVQPERIVVVEDDQQTIKPIEDSKS